jgi:hypothetical protein
MAAVNDVEILITCPHCGGCSSLAIVEDPQEVYCSVCDTLLFQYERVNTQSGFVYILSNPDIPDLVKIGCTRRPVLERAQELASQTAAPGAFVVEAYFAVADPFDAERKIHEQVVATRVEGKEFFRIPVWQAVETLTELLGVEPDYDRCGERKAVDDRPKNKLPQYPPVDWRQAK